jgi:diguanylate cyclase (GGDEF)-like protein
MKRPQGHLTKRYPYAEMRIPLNDAASPPTPVSAPGEYEMSEAVFPITIEAQRPGAAVSVNGLMALSLAVALGFSIICAGILWQERRSAWEHAGQTASNLVEAINSDIGRNIEQFNLSLQGVIEGLKLLESNDVSPRIRQAILFDHSAGARYLGSIRVLNQAGDVIFHNSGMLSESVNYSDRDFFKVHQESTNGGLYISAPYKSPTRHVDVVAFSRRISSADGSFAGVVVGAVRLSYFHDLFKKVSPSPRSALTLFQTDGTVLMRLPLREGDIGRRLTTAYVLQSFQVERKGIYQNVALLDGIDRLYAYSQVAELPLLMVVGIPLDEVYASWRSEALIASLLMIALCCATVLSAVLLRRELRRRMAAEEKLAVLATTDSLTGLSNRRHFDEAITREWQRATREQTSIALLLIDADHFKAYNDTHGHQSGDKLLQAIGASIVDRARRATDLGARYGGDEFILLLPSTGGKPALDMAEWIRKSVRDLHLPSEAAPATVSVGVAVMTPRPGMDHRELIDAADKALYSAKANGRDRAEMIEQAPEAGQGSRLVA